MNLRLALYRLAAEHRLDAQACDTLAQCAGLDRQPADVARRVAQGMAVLAAALIGVGLVSWVAANWQGMSRFARFGLLQAVVLALCAGAAWRPGARGPLALLAFLAVGALFASFGQTYQTGADPWQLFATWALLCLPLALAVRSDVLWAPWALVAMTAVSLWLHAHTGHRWQVKPQDLGAHALAWSAALALVLALGPRASRWTGAGPWARRTAVTLAVTLLTGSALGALFHAPVAPHYALGLFLLAAASAALSRPRSFEVYGLGAAALGVNTLMVAGLARWLLGDPDPGEPIGRLLLIGLAAAGLLAATVQWVLRQARCAAQASTKERR